MRRLKALALFIIGTVILSTLVLVAAETFGPDLLLQTVKSASGEMGGPDIDASLSIDVLEGIFQAENIKVQFPEGNSLVIDGVLVEVDLLPLFSNRLVVPRVEILKPRVHWSLPSGTDPPEETKPPIHEEDSPFSFPELPFDVELGEVSIRDVGAELALAGEEPSTLEKLSISLEPHKGIHRLHLESGPLKGFIADMKLLVTRIEAQADLDFSAKRLDLSFLHLTLPQTLLSLAGSLDAESSEAALFLHLHLPLDELVRVIRPAVPGMLPLTGLLTIDLETQGSLSNPKALGMIKLDDVAWQTKPDINYLYNPREFHLPFEIDRTGVTVEDGLWYTGDAGNRMGFVHFPKAHIAFDDKLTTRADLRCEDCDVAQICEDFSVRDSRARFRANGPLWLAGTLNPFDLRGEVDFDITNLYVDAKPYRQALAGNSSLILHLPKAHFHTGQELNGSYYRFVNGLVTAGESRVAVPVTQFGFDEHFHFEYTSDHINMNDVGPIAGMTYEGIGSVWMTLDGPAGEPLITAGADLNHFSLEGFPTGRTKTDIRYWDAVLQFQNIEARKPSGLIRGKLDVDFSHDPLKLYAEAQTEGLSIKDLIHTTQLDDSFAQNLSGTVVGQGVVQGTPDDLNGGAKLSFTSFAFSGQRMDKGRCQADFQHNNVRFSNCVLERDEARLEASGTLTGWQEWDIQVASQGLELGMIDALNPMFNDNHSSMILKGRVEGSMNAPRINADMLWAPTLLRGAPLGPSEFHLEITSDYLKLIGSLFGKQLKHKVLASFDSSNAVALEAQATQAQLAPWLTLTTGVRVDSLLVSGTMQAQALVSDFWNMKGKADVSSMVFLQDGQTLKNATAFSVLFEKNKLRLPPVTFLGKSSNLEVQASWQKNKMADILVRGTTDLRALEAFSEEVEQAYGPVRLSLHWFGKGNRPHYVGSLSVSQGFIKFSDWDTPLENLQASLDLDTGHLSVGNLQLGYNGGSLKANGLMTLNPTTFQIENTDISAQVDRVLFPLHEDIDPILSGSLRVTGAPWPLQLSGNLEIKQLDYVKDIPWKRALITDKIRSVIRPRKGAQALEQAEATPPNLRFDIHIQGDNTLRIRNNVADLELKADLILSGTDQHPGLLNTISTDTGQIFFQDNEFEVQRFIVDFRDETKLDPFVDISATYNVSYMEDSIERSTTITLSLRGPVEDPELLLTADNGMNQTDILSLLVLGQTTSNVQRGQGMSTGLGALSDVYGVNQQIKKQFMLDEFRLSGDTTDDPDSGTSLTPKLVVGKEIAQDVFLYFTTSLGGEADAQNDKKFEVKYRKKNWTLSGQWDNDGESEQGNFGFDLQYHIDF